MTLNEVIATAKDAGFDGVILEMIAHTYKLGAENEREACAKLVEPSADHRANPSDYIAHEQGIELLDGIAKKIRARGEA